MKKLSLKIENLEERIAPTIFTPGLPDGVEGTTTAQNTVPDASKTLWDVFDGDEGPGASNDHNPGNGRISH